EKLRERGFAVDVWSSVDQKQAASIDANYDLLVLDVRGVQDAFGAKDGIEALQMLRDDNPWIPILMDSSYICDLTRDRKKTVRTQTQETLDKIARYPDFEARIWEWLTRGRTREYALSRLEALGHPAPEEVLKACELVPGSTPILPETEA